MKEVLIVGLDKMAEKISAVIKHSNYNVLGFDFDVDKIISFKNENIIDNSVDASLQKLLSKADIIILNIDYQKYTNVIKLLPFAKNDCLIINTNLYKKNIGKLLNTKEENFLSCNFLLFPQSVIINYGDQDKMNTIFKASAFFKDIKIKTSALSAKENNNIFLKIYQIPFLIDKTILKNSPFFILENSSEYQKYNFFHKDILENKKKIIIELEDILNTISSLKEKKDFFNLLTENNVLKKNSYRLQKESSDEELVIKIIIEKIFIKNFVDIKIEEYINMNDFYFDYKDYNISEIQDYIDKNFSQIKISMLLIKEKLINTISLLSFEDFPLSKLVRYLDN